MGPYRHNAAPLRARREQLRLELDELEAKMTELSVARDVVERTIDDIDVQLQTGFRPPRRRPPAGRRLLAVFLGGVSGIAALLTIGVAAAPRTQPYCAQAAEKQTIILLPAPKLNPQ